MVCVRSVTSQLRSADADLVISSDSSDHSDQCVSACRRRRMESGGQTLVDCGARHGPLSRYRRIVFKSTFVIILVRMIGLGAPIFEYKNAKGCGCHERPFFIYETAMKLCKRAVPRFVPNRRVHRGHDTLSCLSRFPSRTNSTDFLGVAPQDVAFGMPDNTDLICVSPFRLRDCLGCIPGRTATEN